MNYFSFLYQCNMIRVFPLCAGVIVIGQIPERGHLSVSPVCGGYRSAARVRQFPCRCFPCVGVIGAHRKSTAPVLMCFPSVAGLSESLAESLLMVYVFPLCVG